MNNVIPVIAGFVVGFLIGLTGMGGGAVMTPFLILVMKLNPIAAVGTDLVFASITKLIGGAKHWQEDNVSINRVAWLAGGSLPAAIITARFAVTLTDNTYFVEELLPKIVGSVLIIVGLILFGRIIRLLGPKEYIEIKWPAPAALVLIGGVGGALVGMTSIGGGTVIMALFLIFFSIPLNYMVGLDVMHGAILALVAALTYAISGQVNWSLAGLMLIGSLPGVWLGARSVKRFDLRIVRGILSALILFAGITMLVGKA